MHTYFLGSEEVAAYARDFAIRLVELRDQAPRVWLTLGVSGGKIGRELAAFVKGSAAEPTAIYRVLFDRTTGRISAGDGDVFPPAIGNQPVVVIDAAVHSGSSMRHLVDALHDAGFAQVLTYSLVVKLTTEFVPCYFGLMIGEHDRAFFQLDRIPNNRLLSRPPFGAVRMLREDDINRTPDHLSCGVPSIDKVTFGDLWYLRRTQGSHVYLFETKGVVAGLIHFRRIADNKLFIDLIANDGEFQGHGIGGVLMRWAENYARACKMSAVELWAIEDRIGFYEKHGYTRHDQIMDLGGGEGSYHLMSRRLLYNLKPEDIVTAA